MAKCWVESGQGWGKVREKTKVGARLGQARSGQGLGKSLGKVGAQIAGQPWIKAGARSGPSSL